MQRVNDMLTLMVLLNDDPTQFVWVDKSAIRYCSNCLLKGGKWALKDAVVVNTPAAIIAVTLKSESQLYPGVVWVGHAERGWKLSCSWCTTVIEHVPCNT